MPSYYTGNYYLNLSQMQVNAKAFDNILYQVGFTWTDNAIAALLGNAQQESTINPGIWQNLDTSNPELGFGLFQWTPSTNYTDWCVQNNYVAGNMEPAIFRLDYELENGLQWIPTTDYPISFHDFLYGDYPLDYLAKAFLHNYERPKVYDDANRVAKATYWYKYLKGEDPDPPGPGPGPTESGQMWWIYYLKRRL